jgi:endonuclease/exonuclease/phosphatase family metal-dependent hydrolase
LIFTLACQPQTQTENTEEKMAAFHVMSYNIRYDNPGDGAHAWPKRKERVANLIRYHEADLLGLQEAELQQLEYLDSALSEHAWVGVGRDDGREAGEFSPVFYRRKLFELLDWGTFWLSETPDEPSLGWDAGIKRIATWTKLLHKGSRDTLYFFNTHFDHRGEEARLQSARLIRQKIDEISGSAPVIVTGDFNTPPDSAPYRALVAEDRLMDAFGKSVLPHQGALSSFSGFEVSEGLEADRRIDFIFVSPQWTVHKHAILTDFQAGAFPSDHLPVIARLQL